MLTELQNIVGTDRASSDEAELYCYSFDSSYVRGKADYVVRPKTAEEVSAVVKLAAAHRIPIVPRGSASGLTGGAVPVQGGIVLDMTGMNRILDIDLENMQVLIEPGIIHGHLNRELAKHGFFFPPDPGSSEMCSLGGLIGNGGSGMHSVKYGTVKDYVLDLEVVLPDGEIIHTGCKAPKTSAGYDLTRLYVGSEGTLGIITKARLRICALPETKSVITAAFARLEDAGTAAVEVLKAGVTPAAMEIMDASALRAIRKYQPEMEVPEGEAMLIFEVDGYRESTSREAALISGICRRCGGATTIARDSAEVERIWTTRRLVSVIISRLSPGKVAIYEAEDIGMPIKDVPRMLRKIRQISERHGLDLVVFGHIGDGDLHTGIAIDLLDEGEWKKVHAVKDEIYDAVLEAGGTLSGEHGIGVIRGDYMPRIYGRGHEIMRAIKKAVDPLNIMNPGKMGF
ncbi:FAD-binding oxidoreductase [Methanocella arvoryzae]|uniref:D-lactate dehydrogenase (cytochrome) n=1 Tax=Methanocella arvoryzae (strain DSM 22066 / NBRC 105507 / MRE50) TaxID=351160 RepID=Q0W2Q0_METAR|nr:FAD-linked oxidase C-terminal domain-containing protein [Methanocella arvoryzae]CAJ37343.1 putative (S)-2-hydroxy-acid dehydrogenase [Methanocella arvoryzae MRE50]